MMQEIGSKVQPTTRTAGPTLAPSERGTMVDVMMKRRNELVKDEEEPSLILILVQHGPRWNTYTSCSGSCFDRAVSTHPEHVPCLLVLATLRALDSDDMDLDVESRERR